MTTRSCGWNLQRLQRSRNNSSWMRQRCGVVMKCHSALASTPPGMPGTHPPQYFGWGGRQREYPRQYYYVLLDIADRYWLPSVRSASSRFHSAIRRHQFASVRQADSRLTRLVPPNLELALTPLSQCVQPAIVARLSLRS